MMLMSDHDDAYVDAMLMMIMQANTRSVTITVLLRRSSVYFLLSWWEILEKTREWPWTKGAEAPDASGVLSVLGPVRVEHRTHCTGRRVFPVHASSLA